MKTMLIVNSVQYQIGVKSVSKWKLFYLNYDKRMQLPKEWLQKKQHTISVPFLGNGLSNYFGSRRFPHLFFLENKNFAFFRITECSGCEEFTFRWLLSLLFDKIVAVIMYRQRVSMGPNKVYDPQSEVFELKFTSDTITLPTAWMSHFNENEDTTKNDSGETKTQYKKIT